MDTVWIIVIMVFVTVAAAFYVGRKSKEHDNQMEQFLEKEKVKETANEIEKTTAALDSNAVRDELRNKLRK